MVSQASGFPDSCLAVNLLSVVAYLIYTGVMLFIFIYIIHDRMKKSNFDLNALPCCKILLYNQKMQ